MLRAKIGLAVTVVIIVLTATAYFLTTTSIERRITDDVEQRVARAQDLLIQNSSLEGLDLIKLARVSARDPNFATALSQSKVNQRTAFADKGFRTLLAEMGKDEDKPDNIALVNSEGQLAAMLDVRDPVAEDWEGQFESVKKALDKHIASKDVWHWRNATWEVGVAPIWDKQTGETYGALVISHALNAHDAKLQADLLGMQVAYFFGDKVFATSFRRGANEDVAKQQQLAGPLFKDGLAKEALTSGRAKTVVSIELNGETYLATAARFPLNLSDRTSGAMVLASLKEAKAPTSVVSLSILLLGLGSLVVALAALLLANRLTLGPAEDIELGVTEIINGNIDFTFKPAGADFDGLANALNVMLARILGRPEPGEDDFEEGGMQSTAVLLDEGTIGKVATDEETLALANEPEADYYRRVYGEYVEARRQKGDDVDGVTFEGFVAKLRLTEANLRKKYNCKSVRFRVQSDGTQVTLKPVPIV